VAELLDSVKQGNEGVVRLSGDLYGGASTERLEDWVEEHFVDDGISQIRLNLSEVTDMDLEGAAAVGLLAAEAIKQHKLLTVEGATGRVLRKLEETGLAQYLRRRQATD